MIKIVMQEANVGKIKLKSPFRGQGFNIFSF
jgi:hypothetical protein